MKSPLSLPVFDRSALDYSILSTHQRCPRKGLIRYWHGRAPLSVNYPMEFGSAYHTYREILEKLYLAHFPEGKGMPDEDQIKAWHMEALTAALAGYPENPPPDHAKAYLTQIRLEENCEVGLDQWTQEKQDGNVRILAVEQAGQLELPNGEQYGFKIDAIIEWNRGVWVRDHKTTTRKGRTYAHAFQVNDQFTGYTWAASQLTGKQVKGCIVNSVYNVTKTIGEHEPFIVTRTQWDIDDWLAGTQAEIAEVRRHEEAGEWPKRTVACDDFGGCWLRECCGHTHSWREQDEWLKGHTKEEVWDFSAKVLIT